MRKLGFIVDTTSGRYTDLAGSPVELPEVAIGDTVLLIGHFREALAANLSDLDLTGATALRAHVKKDRLASDTTTLTFQDSYNDGNAAAWESLADGKVTWLVSFATAALTSALGAAAYVDIWLEFSWLDATGTIPQTLAQIPIRLVPQIDTGAAGTPPPAAPTYYTATEVLQILATTYQGAWSAATAYTTGQTVSHEGGYFLALQDSTASEPDVTASTADWALLATPGTDGTDGAGFQTWTAPDLDTGTETLVEWTAPVDARAVWRVTGQVGKGAAMIAFEALVAWLPVADGYGGYSASLVQLAVQHTTQIGDCSDVTWEATPGAGDIYTDYDATSGKVRLRAAFASDNWDASGIYARAV